MWFAGSYMFYIYLDFIRCAAEIHLNLNFPTYNPLKCMIALWCPLLQINYVWAEIIPWRYEGRTIQSKEPMDKSFKWVNFPDKDLSISIHSVVFTWNGQYCSVRKRWLGAHCCGGSRGVHGLPQPPAIKYFPPKTCCFVWFDYLRPINNLSVKQGRVFLGWTSIKLG